MTSFEQYTPREISALDALAAAKRIADQIIRNNPLTNAVVSRGLMQWRGNHVDIDGDKVNFLWIGDFFPADPTMGGIPQKGIVMWRDDSTASSVDAGRIAFALYDHDPGGGGLGLRQTIHLDSLDGKHLLSESRKGGQEFPHMNVPMGATGSDTGKWASTDSTSFATVLEGFTHAVGNQLYARFWTQTQSTAAGEFRVTVTWSGGTITGTLFTQAVNTVTFREDTLDVTAARGEMLQVKVEARRSSGTGSVAAAPISFRNFTA